MSGALSRRNATQREEGGANASQLWPLLALDEAARPTRSAPDGAATLPSDVAERLLAQELRDGQTLRSLRLVSRACRAAVDARLRSLRVGYLDDSDRPDTRPVRDVCKPLGKLARFQGLRSLDVYFNFNSSASLPLLASGLPHLRRLEELNVRCSWTSLPTAVVRALPQSLKVLKVVVDDVGGLKALIEASAARPQLRVLDLKLWMDEPDEECAPLAAAVCRVLERAGGWSTLTGLGLPYLDPGAYAALAAATQLTGLRSLSVHNCCSDPANGYEKDREPLPPHLSEDNGLHLLAAAPWIRGLTELRLGTPCDWSYAPTDKLFTGLELPGLESLAVSGFTPSPAGASDGPPLGLASLKLPALTKLEFELSEERDADRIGEALVAAPWYAGVSHLNLDLGYVKYEGGYDEWDGVEIDARLPRALLSAPFRSLTSLVVRGVPLTRAVVGAIAEAPALRRLRSLEMIDNLGSGDGIGTRATSAQWGAFAAAPFNELRELCLGEARLSQMCKAAVMGAAWITQLTRLRLDPLEPEEDAR